MDPQYLKIREALSRVVVQETPRFHYKSPSDVTSEVLKGLNSARGSFVQAQFGAGLQALELGKELEE